MFGKASIKRITAILLTVMMAVSVPGFAEAEDAAQEHSAYSDEYAVENAPEADLTDAECHRLQQQYVVPAMRADMPDSAMYYLTEAIYATMQKKDMPEMSSLSSHGDEIDSEILTTMGLYMLFMLAWIAFFLHLNRKYQWLALLGVASLHSNPFYDSSSSGGGGSWGGSSGSSHSSWGGGGGFSGGSFGGGSFCGGGATSSW